MSQIYLATAKTDAGFLPEQRDKNCFESRLGQDSLHVMIYVEKTRSY